MVHRHIYIVRRMEKMSNYGLATDMTMSYSRILHGYYNIYFEVYSEILVHALTSGSVFCNQYN